MGIPPRRSRLLVTAGLTAMVLGAVDPLEGSVVIALGSGLVVLGTPRGRSEGDDGPVDGRLDGRVAERVRLSCVLVVVGVASLWILSAFGGVGGGTGRSMWWLLLVAPYPAGWLLGLVGAVQRLRALARAGGDPPLG